MTLSKELHAASSLPNNMNPFWLFPSQKASLQYSTSFTHSLEVRVYAIWNFDIENFLQCQWENVLTLIIHTRLKKNCSLKALKGFKYKAYQVYLL